MQADEIKKSLDEVNEALRLEPHNAKSLTRRAFCYHALGDFDKALADANEAIMIDPKLDRAWEVRGRILCRRGEDDAAFYDFNEAIRLNPNNVEALVGRGHVRCFSMNQLQAAEQDVTEALRLDPNHGYAYLVRAEANWHLDQDERALADYDKAINLQGPSRAWSKELFRCHAYAARGKYYRSCSLLDLAISDYTEALRLCPETRLPLEGRITLLRRANTFLRKGDLSKALEDCTEAIRLGPDYFMAYQDRAVVFRALDDKPSAEKDEDKVRELRKTLLGAQSTQGG